MTVTVLMSVFAHGISAAPLTRRYAQVTGALAADGPEHEPVTELPLRRRAVGETATAQ